ncbi:MAG: hypothetical protein RLN82_01285, partial [Pseudomonadales bacterium]
MSAKNILSILTNFLIEPQRNMKHLLALALITISFFSMAQERKAITPGPNRKPNEGGGPYDRLIIRGVNMIDGTGGPPTGPVDIVVERNKIVEIKTVGVPHIPIDESKRPKLGTKGNTKEIDATGKYIMPGIIDLHVHTGGEVKAEEAEYVYKLWLGNGITTVRGVPFGPLEWSVSESQRSAKN